MSKPITQQEVRAAVQTQIIECLNRFYAVESGMWGGPLEALIIRTAVAGEMQHRPYDLSALAAALNLPLSTIHRKVKMLVKMGVVVQEKAGRSIYLHPTSRTREDFDKSFGEMVGALQRLNRDPALVLAGEAGLGSEQADRSSA